MLDSKTLSPLIQQELAEANKVHPQFASHHEGYAVLKEEVEETAEMLNSIYADLKLLWHCVREDIEPTIFAETIHSKSMLLMAEAAQVGAMALKILNIK